MPGLVRNMFNFRNGRILLLLSLCRSFRKFLVKSCLEGSKRRSGPRVSKMHCRLWKCILIGALKMPFSRLIMMPICLMVMMIQKHTLGSQFKSWKETTECLKRKDRPKTHVSPSKNSKPSNAKKLLMIVIACILVFRTPWSRVPLIRRSLLVFPQENLESKNRILLILVKDQYMPGEMILKAMTQFSRLI